jgi:hypothetical protein
MNSARRTKDSALGHAPERLQEVSNDYKDITYAATKVHAKLERSS